MKELDAEIIAIVGDVELDDEIVQADEFHEKNLDTFVQINRALTPAATSSAPPTTTPSSSHPHGANASINVKPHYPPPGHGWGFDRGFERKLSLMGGDFELRVRNL